MICWKQSDVAHHFLKLAELGRVPTYLTRFCNFSSLVIAATRAAARADGESDALHTWFLASGPLTQSGEGLRFWALMTPATPRAKIQEDFMMISRRRNKNGIEILARQKTLRQEGCGLNYKFRFQRVASRHRPGLLDRAR